jgi:toxin ParE1/3/4
VAHRVYFLRRAESRLAELGFYIASEAGFAVADRYLDRIYSACMALAEFPERGRSRDDILPGLRTITMEPGNDRVPRTPVAGRDCHYCLCRAGFRG